MNIKTEIIDWAEEQIDPKEGWFEGLPLKPFLNPDVEFQKILGSLKFTLINERNCNGEPEVQVSGKSEDVDWFSNMFEESNKNRGQKVLDYCERWIESNLPELWI